MYSPGYLPVGIIHVIEDLTKLINGEEVQTGRINLILKQWTEWLQRAFVGQSFVEKGWVVESHFREHFEEYMSLKNIWGDQTSHLLLVLLASVSTYRGMLSRDEPARMFFPTEADRTEALAALRQLIDCGWSTQE